MTEDRLDPGAPTTPHRGEGAPGRPRRTPRRRRPGRRNRTRLWILAALMAALGLHMAAWYGLGWRAIGKFSFSGFASLAVGHLNMAAVFCLAIGLGLVFTGRLFCGYACKLSALQEATEWAFARVGFRPRLTHTRARVARVFIWVPYLLPVLYVWRDEGLSTAYVDLGAVAPWTADLPQTVLASAFYFASVTLVLTAVFGRRAFCRLVCPFALMFGAFERLPWVPRVVQQGRCIDCSVCDQACPMGVDVARSILRQSKVTDSECIKCMVCIDVCPVKALRFGRQASVAPQRPALAPATSESAFPPALDLVLALLAVAGGVWAATQITGFHVFLGVTWGLVAGALGWRAARGLARLVRQPAAGPDARPAAESPSPVAQESP